MVTNKHVSPTFSIPDLRDVTNELNNTEVKIPDIIFAYRSYIGMSSKVTKEEQFVNLAILLEEFALLYKKDIIFLLRGHFERFFSVLMEKDYCEVADPNNKIYDNYMKIIKINKLSTKVYKKDILFVYEDDTMLVVTDRSLALKFRELRGNK